MRAVAAAAVLVSAATASADDESIPRAMIGVGVGMHGANTESSVALYYIEGQDRVRRIPGGAIYAHGAFAHGEWLVDRYGGGHWSHYRGGVEVRLCADRGGYLCAYVDADLGFLAIETESGTGTQDGATLGARVGVDVGVHALRVRVACDWDRAFGDLEASNGVMTLDLRDRSAIEVGVGIQF